jgi:predicted TIM-barrel fold metal-dependent hydrolase
VDPESVRALGVIDVDTHVIEPVDLWTSRMSSRKWGDLVPHVKWDEESQEEQWFVGEKPIYRAGIPAAAGWHQFTPDHPVRREDFDPVYCDARLRAKYMDEVGIEAEVLYPNVGIFAYADHLGTSIDPLFALDCVRAYNDFLIDFASEAPGRYVPVANLPFWDLEATLTEIERVLAKGHKGLVLSSQPENFDLPPLASDHWDPLWAQAQAADVPINFHIGSGKVEWFGLPENGKHATYAWSSALIFQGNVKAVASVIFSGICHRFPNLNFVSVESGIGWIPPSLETMDWQWLNSGVPQEHPEYELLPSEYFKRQIYGCFWFERGAARAAVDQLGPDNFMYETDYPHPTSMSPGPASVAVSPMEYITGELGGLPRETVKKLVHDNAVRLYKL